MRRLTTSHIYLTIDREKKRGRGRNNEILFEKKIKRKTTIIKSNYNNK